MPDILLRDFMYVLTEVSPLWDSQVLSSLRRGSVVLTHESSELDSAGTQQGPSAHTCWMSVKFSPWINWGLGRLSNVFKVVPLLVKVEAQNLNLGVSKPHHHHPGLPPPMYSIHALFTPQVDFHILFFNSKNAYFLTDTLVDLYHACGYRILFFNS